MVEALVAEAERLVAEGVEARLAAADAAAEAEAEADRRACSTRRDDANATAVRIEHIRRPSRRRPTGTDRSGGVGGRHRRPPVVAHQRW